MFSKLILPTLLSAAVFSLPAYSRTPVAPNSDASFLKMAAEADMTAANIGKVAEDRAAVEPVKDLGKTLVQDHTADYQQLTQVAAKAGEAIPTAIDKSGNRTISTLDRYKGKAFDHEFLTREAVEHEELVRAFKREAEHGTNPAIKAYASQALPTIERHLHEVQDLLKKRA